MKPTRQHKMFVIPLTCSLFVLSLISASAHADLMMHLAPRLSQQQKETAQLQSHIAWDQNMLDLFLQDDDQPLHYSPLKSSLMQARSNIQDAMADLQTLHDPVAARKHLQQARIHFNGARGYVNRNWTDPLYKDQLADLQQRLQKQIQTPADIDPRELSHLQHYLRLLILSS